MRTADDECFLSTKGNRDRISPLSSSALGNGGLFDGRIDKMRSVECVSSDVFADGFSGVDELDPLQYPVVSEFGIDSLLKIIINDS